MAKTPALTGLLAGCLLALSGTRVSAQPAVSSLLALMPTQKDASISTPSTEEQKSCEVKLFKGSQPGSSGWLLLDARKQPVRRFFDSNGDKQIDIWSYFKDGVEVYREVDTNFNGKADQFRWLNTAGMKWGVDTDEDGRIDTWRMISAEEVGQEAFHAMASRDFTRLKALFISEAEMAALKLPQNQVQRLTTLQTGAAKKFGDVSKSLPQLASAKFVRVETAPPSCVLGEQIGSDHDLIKYTSRSILYESESQDGKKEKKHEWLATGEILQVGLAWRLVDVPSQDEQGPGRSEDDPTKGERPDPELTRHFEALSKLDENPPPPVTPGTRNPQLETYLRRRIELVEQILTRAKTPAVRENFYKQLCDNLATAIQNGDGSAKTRLSDLRKDAVERMPGSNLAAYVVYREMWSEYAVNIAKENDQKKISELQEKWLDSCAKFVQVYPRAEDVTPEVLFLVGTGAEFAGKEKEEEAKRWYGQITKNFPQHALAEKARGAEARLSLVGNTVQIAGTQMNGSPFDMSQVKGKVVVVYYWASYVNQCVGDFARLKKAYNNLSSKGVDLVCVNLDDNFKDAGDFLKSTPIPGTHLISAVPGKTAGLSSPLAMQYGITALPTMFLVGRDGKVINNRLQIGELEAELGKAAN